MSEHLTLNALETHSAPSYPPFRLRLRRSGCAFCPVCEKLVDLVTYEAAGLLFRTDRRDLDELAGRQLLHRVHNSRGILMICGISLFDCFQARETRPLDPGFEEAVAGRRSTGA